MSRIKSLLFLLALAAQVPLASATVTYAVGNCKPSLRSFTTINGALAATPPPNVVQVCPGTYPEEVGIYIPVTLEGISAANSEQAIIAVPAGGMFINAGDDFGDFLAAQILVQATGAVNISNITVDATGNNVASGSGTYVVGVFYQNSSGTVNRLVIRNQAGNGAGMGVWLEGGSANPSVTVENNSLQGFDNTGIFAETSSASSSVVTSTIKGNYLAGTVGNSTGILLNYGGTASVSSNLITGSLEGVLIEGGGGSVSENKLVGTQIGIDIETNGASVTSNTIYNAGTTGILANATIAPVTGNTIAQSSIGVSFNCTAGNNVHSNTILDAVFGLYQISTAGAPNTYYNVSSIYGGGC